MTPANNISKYKETIFLVFTFFIIIGTMFLSTLDTPTGLATLSNKETKTLNLDDTYAQNSTIDVSLKKVEKISATGTYKGNLGDKAKIYAKTNEGAIILIAEITLEESTTTVSQFTAQVTGQTQEEQENEIEEETTTNEEEITVEDEIIIEETTEENLEELLNETTEVDEVDDLVEDDMNELLEEEIIIGSSDEIVEESPEETITDDEVDEVEDVVEDDLDEVLEEEIIEETSPEDNQTVINETTEEPQTFDLIKEFNNLCTQTCALIGIDISQIIIEIETGELYIEKITYTQESEYLGEGITQKVENIQIKKGENKTINAQNYFEEENLVFDAKSSEGYTHIVNQNEINFIAQKIGTWESIIYATNGTDLIVSNKFNITITEQEEQEIIEEPSIPDNNETITNETITIDIPINETIIGNETMIGNETITNETIIGDIPGCDYPDPNQRPLECIQNENTTYFQPEDLVLENTRGTTIARFTPIGNLLIKGDFVENSQEQAKTHDYQLGYVNNQGEFIPTIWINSETGDLHLKGKLTESNSNIVMEQGLSAITNKRGILLATINRQTGDMKIRGNVVPYRRSLE